MKAYLAGPDVFAEDSDKIFRLKKRVLKEHGIEGIAPLDNAISVPAMYQKGYTDEEVAEAIFEANKEAMRTADCCFANLTPWPESIGADTGTAFEMGFFEALGKPIFTYNRPLIPLKIRHSNQQPLLEDEYGAVRRGSDKMMVEDFGLKHNLMLACAGRASSAPTVGDSGGVSEIAAMTAFKQAAQAAENALAQPDTEQISAKTGRFDSVPDGYDLVRWPESQQYMQNDDAVLVLSGELYQQEGDMTYLVPEDQT